MVFIYIFAGAFVGMIILITTAHIQQKNSTQRSLQNNDYWYNIDLVAIHEKAHTQFHRIVRPVFRNVIHKALGYYLRSVNRIRRSLRRHINALLDYYAEEHDQLYHKKPSQFIEEIRAHKKMTKNDNKDLQSLDEYSQK